MPEDDSGLRRVCIHAGSCAVDVALPSLVPIATLIPEIVDLLGDHGVGRCADPMRYQLARLGAPALQTSTTLAENEIRDGAALFLTQHFPKVPAPPYDDEAEAVSTALGAEPANAQAAGTTAAGAAAVLPAVVGAMLVRNALISNTTGHRETATAAAIACLLATVGAAIAHRSGSDPIAGRALNITAFAFAATAGFLAVPGQPGTHNVLLAAMAAALASVLAIRLTAGNPVVSGAVACFAIIVAIAALAGVATAAAPHAIGSATALVSLGLLGVAPRAAIIGAGLSPQLSVKAERQDAHYLADKAIRADHWLTSLIAALTSAAAAGAVITALTGASRFACVLFCALTGSLLLLRARCDRTRLRIFVPAGMITTTTAFAVTATRMPQHGTWLVAVTVLFTAGALFVGFAVPAMSVSPVLRRGVELLEGVALVAMVPLTCSICGVYDTVRSMNPAWI